MAWFWGILSTFSDFIEHHIGAITAVIAAAAVVQWRETRKTDERQLRAYVLNFTATLYDGTTMPNAIVNRANQAFVALVIKNHGQTPAYRLIHTAEIAVAPVTNEARMFIPDNSMGNDELILGPDTTSSANRWLNRPITPQEQLGIMNGTYAIYAYGRVEYVDAFKRRRWTTYRLQYTGSAWPPVAGAPFVGMNFCSKGNDAN